MLKIGTSNEENRYNWIRKTLLTIPAGLSILDAGAGECQFKHFCAHLNYTSQDFGEYHGDGHVGLQTGKWDNSKIDIVSDIINIPLPDNSVDAIMCTEVLEHIPDPAKAIVEFNRLIKPGGYLIITSPFASLTHFAPYHFASGLSRFYYEHHLPKNNFTITELDFNGNFFEFVGQETRRIAPLMDKYNLGKLSWFEKRVLYLTLQILQKYSKKDKSSSELLCFGIHVFARKAP